MQQEIKKCTLFCPNENCFINRFCSPSWIDLLNENKTMIRFKRNNLIIREGDLVLGIYFIYEGKVKIHTEGIDGKESIIRLAKSGEILGHRGFTEKTYPISATALENTTVCFLKKEVFIRALQENINLTYNLLLFLLDELRRSENKTRTMAQKSVAERIAENLLYIEDVFGTTSSGMINLTISRKDIAHMTGSSYETVIRTLHDLTDQELISHTGKKIQILNRNKLRELSEHKLHS